MKFYTDILMLKKYLFPVSNLEYIVNCFCSVFLIVTLENPHVVEYRGS